MSANPATRERLRHLPNALSMARIAAAPVLLVLALGGRQALFTWVLVPALLTDIADGWLARRFHLESKRGAFLDSLADSLLLIATVFGLWTFHRGILVDNALLCGTVVALWVLENLVALVRYGRLSSFHTYVSKTAGYLLGIYAGVLFVFGHYAWLLYLAGGLSILGSFEEFALLAVLPRWRSDVGGLWWVLKEPRRPA